MARFKSHRRSNRRARLRSCIAPHVAVHVLRALDVLIMPTKGRLCVSGRLPPAPSPSGVPYSSYCPRGGGAAVVRLLSQLLRRRDCCRTTAVGGRDNRAGECERALPSVRLTRVQVIGVSQPGTDSGCPSQRVSLKNLKIGAIAPAIARNKWPSAAGSNALAFKCRDSSPIVPTAARGRPRASRARGSDHVRERAALCQRPTSACS